MVKLTVQEQKDITSLCLCMIGLSIIMLPLPVSIVMQLIIFYIGWSTALIGLFRLMKSLYFNYFPQKPKSLLRDERGIGWQLTAFTAGIIGCIFAWFIAAWPTDQVWQMMSSFYVFTGATATAIAIVRQIIALSIGIAIFVGIIWLWVSTHREGV